ncbi:MAG: SRPBCC family protein [Sporichthyaceae bacterium]
MGPGVVVEHASTASAQEVMNVLRDGWLFAVWVVGASQIRDVDAGWPKPGTRIHHAVGAWPLLVKDYTEVLEYDPDGRLVLRARAWPFGEALVTLQVDAAPTGSRIAMAEDVRRGPGTLVRPLAPLLFPPRNRESLSRLAAIAEHRT